MQSCKVQCTFLVCHIERHCCNKPLVQLQTQPALHAPRTHRCTLCALMCAHLCKWNTRAARCDPGHFLVVPRTRRLRTPRMCRSNFRAQMLGDHVESAMCRLLKNLGDTLPKTSCTSGLCTGLALSTQPSCQAPQRDRLTRPDLSRARHRDLAASDR